MLNIRTHSEHLDWTNLLVFVGFTYIVVYSLELQTTVALKCVRILCIKILQSRQWNHKENGSKSNGHDPNLHDTLDLWERKYDLNITCIWEN